MSSNDPSSICDACGAELALAKVQACEHCGASCCEECIGDLDHDCARMGDAEDVDA